MTRPPPRSTLFPYTTALPIFQRAPDRRGIESISLGVSLAEIGAQADRREPQLGRLTRSEEHTSELQSHHDLVCRLLLEKKNQMLINPFTPFCRTSILTLSIT